MQTSLTDSQLLDLLRAGDNQSVDLLYRRYYPSVEYFVIQNSGDKDQAHDLFQETLVVLLTAIRDPSFQLTSSLKTYVFSISRNLWLKQLKKSARWTGLETVGEDRNVTAPVDAEVPPTAYQTVMGIMVKLTLRCMKLLSSIFFGQKDMTQIMKDDGYSSLHSAQNQKYKCLEQARKIGKTLHND
ncbi:RNA polymerase sigma factor [Spirosoma gilvum]